MGHWASWWTCRCDDSWQGSWFRWPLTVPMVLSFFKGRSLLLTSDVAHSVCTLEQPLEHTSCDTCRWIGRPVAAKHRTPGPTHSSLSTSPSQGSTAALLPGPCSCTVLPSRALPALGWGQLASAAGVTQSLGHSSSLCALWRSQAVGARWV